MSNQYWLPIFSRLRDGSIPGYDLRVLSALLCKGISDAPIIVHQTELAETCNMRRQHVWRAIQSLRERKIIAHNTVQRTAILLPPESWLLGAVEWPSKKEYKPREAEDESRIEISGYSAGALCRIIAAVETAILKNQSDKEIANNIKLLKGEYEAAQERRGREC